MARSAKKYRNKKPVSNQVPNQLNSTQAPSSTILKPVSGASSKTSSPSYNAGAHIKKDIKWTLFTTLIVAIVLVIIYIFLR
jgi:hypothetical protein